MTETLLSSAICITHYADTTQKDYSFEMCLSNYAEALLTFEISITHYAKALLSFAICRSHYGRPSAHLEYIHYPLRRNIWTMHWSLRRNNTHLWKMHSSLRRNTTHLRNSHYSLRWHTTLICNVQKQNNNMAYSITMYVSSWSMLLTVSYVVSMFFNKICTKCR